MVKFLSGAVWFRWIQDKIAVIVFLTKPFGSYWIVVFIKDTKAFNKLISAFFNFFK